MVSIFQAIFPHPIPFRTLEELAVRPSDDGKITKAMYEKALSDFTRVVEEMGILDQKETPLTKQESKHD